MKISTYILLFGFLLFLVFPHINELTGIVENVNTEKRKKVKRPTFNIKKIKNWIPKFNNYYKKEFSGRSFYFKTIARLKHNILSSSILPNKVVVGKDDFLFLGNRHNKTIDETLGLNVFSQKELNIIKRKLNQQAEWFRKKGIKFHVAVAPNKNAVHQDKLPFEVNNNKRKIHQLLALEDLNVPITYMLPDYKPEVDSLNLFIPKNTHWNKLGAFKGYNQLAKNLNKIYPHIKPLSLDDYYIYEIPSTKEDIALMLNLKINDRKISIKRGTNRITSKQLPKKYPKRFSSRPTSELRYKNIINKKGKKIKILVFRDSFATALVEYFNLHFDETVFLWTSKMDKSLIKAENPDIVVFEIVERNLNHMMGL